MKAIPQLQSGGVEQVSGLSCPDCPGVLQVSLLGTYLHFRCRIGHSYSLVELIRAKEDRLEALLWAPVTAFEELAALLSDAIDAHVLETEDQRLSQRLQLARQQAARLREVIENDAVTIFGSGEVG